MTAPTMAIDVAPADYTILPGGTALGMIYCQRLSASNLVVNDTNVPDAAFEANIVILRNVNYFQLGSMATASHIVVPSADIGRANIGGASIDTSSGIGEGTCTFTPQVGLIQGLSKGWFFDGVVDVAFQRDHEEDGLTFSRGARLADAGHAAQAVRSDEFAGRRLFRPPRRRAEGRGH